MAEKSHMKTQKKHQNSLWLGLHPVTHWVANSLG